MIPYRLTPAAEDDLFQIWSFIAEDDPEAADRLEEEIFRACDGLASRPDLGHFRRDLTDKPVRFLCVRKYYLVVYDPVAVPVTILRVLHGARDITVEL